MRPSSSPLKKSLDGHETHVLGGKNPAEGDRATLSQRPGGRIVGFFVRLILLYALLGPPWPGLKEGYAALFRGGANIVYGAFGSQGLVRFRPMVPEQEMWDTEVTLTNRYTGRGRTIGFSCRYTGGYLPLAMVVALVLSTPVAWPRRWRALVWGILLVYLFVLLSVALLLLLNFRVGTPAGIYNLGPFWTGTVGILVEVFSVSPVTPCVVAVFIWIFVTFRGSDWAGLLGQANAPTAMRP